MHRLLRFNGPLKNYEEEECRRKEILSIACIIQERAFQFDLKVEKHWYEKRLKWPVHA